MHYHQYRQKKWNSLKNLTLCLGIVPAYRYATADNKATDWYFDIELLHVMFTPGASIDIPHFNGRAVKGWLNIIHNILFIL